MVGTCPLESSRRHAVGRAHGRGRHEIAGRVLRGTAQAVNAAGQGRVGGYGRSGGSGRVIGATERMLMVRAPAVVAVPKAPPPASAAGVPLVASPAAGTTGVASIILAPHCRRGRGVRTDPDRPAGRVEPLGKDGKHAMRARVGRIIVGGRIGRGRMAQGSRIQQRSKVADQLVHVRGRDAGIGQYVAAFVDLPDFVMAETGIKYFQGLGIRD